MPTAIPHRLRHSFRASCALARTPRDGVDRLQERIGVWGERRAPRPLRETPDVERRLHAALGAPWPCAASAEFRPLWDSAVVPLRRRGLRVGRATYCGWDDADPRLARVAWCLTRHLRPATVVETGVGRGLTTRVVLEALERNHDGVLWSIDLPPLAEAAPDEEIGAAVGPQQRARWTLLRGSSRRVLPVLVRLLGGIDLFVHDSLHTTRNVRFELETVWPALAPGGAVLVDDVDKNRAFAAFAGDHRPATALVLDADDGAAQLGCLLKPAAG